VTTPIQPNSRASIAITANATSQNVAMPAGGGMILRFINRGPDLAFIEITNDANFTCAVPTANGGGGACIAANVSHQDFIVPAGANRIAAISAGNSALYVTRGKTHA
jgi:hypothetical protein